MTRRAERLALTAGTFISVVLVTTGLVWATRSSVASGYHVGSWTLLAGILAALGGLIGFTTWAVFGPRQEDRRGR